MFSEWCVNTKQTLILPKAVQYSRELVQQCASGVAGTDSLRDIYSWT